MPFKFNPVTGNLDLVNTPLDLSGYVPYTGATTDVDLGTNGLTLKNITATDGIVSFNVRPDDNSVFMESNSGDIDVLDDVVVLGPNNSTVGKLSFSSILGGNNSIQIPSTSFIQRAYVVGNFNTATGGVLFQDTCFIGQSNRAVNSVNNIVIGERNYINILTGNNNVVIGGQNKIGPTSGLMAGDFNVLVGVGGRIASGTQRMLFSLNNEFITDGTNDALYANNTVDNSILFAIKKVGLTQQNLLQLELDKGVRIGAISGENIAMTGDDLFINGHLEVGEPIYLTSNTLLGTPVAGTIEFSNDRFYITDVDTQRTIDRTSDVKLDTTTVANTTTETVLYTGTLPSNSLKAGNHLKVFTDGVLGTLNSSSILTIRVKMNGTTVSTLELTGTNYTNAPWSTKLEMTVRSVGASGSIAVHTDLNVGSSKLNAEQTSTIETIDTTVSEDITITAQWGTANADNTISCHQGHLEVKG